MAESDLTFSPETARQAARYFFSRRYRTSFGVLFTASIVLVAIAIPVWIHYFGANWFAGMLGTLLGANLIIHIASFTTRPRALAQYIAGLQSPIGHVAVTDEKLTISLGGNVANIAWSRIRHIWPQERFVVLALSFFSSIHLPTDGMSSDMHEELQRRAAALEA